MSESTKKKLIDIYERSKGSKGCYMHMLSNYRNDIIRMHSDNTTIFMIQEFILDDLNYSFQELKEEDAFKRAIRTFIKTKVSKDDVKKVEQLDLTGDRKPEGNRVKRDRSGLLVEDNASEEARKVFQKKS